MAHATVSFLVLPPARMIGRAGRGRGNARTKTVAHGAAYHPEIALLLDMRYMTYSASQKRAECVHKTLKNRHRVIDWSDDRSTVLDCLFSGCLLRPAVLPRLMATRDLTAIFLRTRQEINASRGRSDSIDQDVQRNELLKGGAGTGVSWEASKNSLPPIWVDTVSEVEGDIRLIHKKSIFFSRT